MCPINRIYHLHMPCNKPLHRSSMFSIREIDTSVKVICVYIKDALKWRKQKTKSTYFANNQWNNSLGLLHIKQTFDVSFFMIILIVIYDSYSSEITSQGPQWRCCSAKSHQCSSYLVLSLSRSFLVVRFDYSSLCRCLFFVLVIYNQFKKAFTVEPILKYFMKAWCSK